MSSAEEYFKQYRDNVIGINATYKSPYGTKKIIYADWIASGRLYGPIEKKIINGFGPFVANTHTETSFTGALMTKAYHHAHEKIKQHVNAGPNDVIVTSGFGMTGVINKLQRILGLKTCKTPYAVKCVSPAERPVVFVTHMEHHSNQTSWYETVAEVVVVEPGDNLLVNPENLKKALARFQERKFKIGSFTACSNVTGIQTPYHELARIMHQAGGLCFVDFAASAPYIDINMHPADPMEKLDAIFFSPHKFLGGPGSSGVMIFDKFLYKNKAPDNPGGGTVEWTNPWGEYRYIDDIETREDGGTPGFLLAFRTALALELKEKMGTGNIRIREDELLDLAFTNLAKIPGLHILAGNDRDRIGCISFYFDNIHYNLAVKLLSDRFGIQVRGGCSCAGTYGHFLLNVSQQQSRLITERINRGDLSAKPGWIRISLHPTMSNKEMHQVIDALNQIAANIDEWKKEYNYTANSNEFYHKSGQDRTSQIIDDWFNLD